MQLMPTQRHEILQIAIMQLQPLRVGSLGTPKKFQDVPGQIRRTKIAIRRSVFLQIEI